MNISLVTVLGPAGIEALVKEWRVLGFEPLANEEGRLERLLHQLPVAFELRKPQVPVAGKYGDRELTRDQVGVLAE